MDGKAAFNNFPYQYGVVERTSSEHKASALDTLPVSQFGTLPLELQQGALRYAYEQSLQAGTNGNFEDGTPRFFTCQTCHMAPTVGQGCAFGAPHAQRSRASRPDRRQLLDAGRHPVARPAGLADPGRRADGGAR